jgi:Na+/alanine symporter
MEFLITAHLTFVIFGFVLTAICAYLFYDERGVDFSSTTGCLLIVVSLAPLLNIFSAMVLSMVVFREIKKRFNKS